MAQIAVNPIRLSNVLLRIVQGAEGGDYEKHVSQVEFSPSSGSVSWKGLHPEAVYNFSTATTWTCTLAYAQDWSSEDSLSGFLFDHEGETVTMVLQPDNGKVISEENPAFRAQVTVVPGTIGGSVDSVATASVTLQVQGRPERITSLL